jgi:hypothetical protein
MQIYGPDRAGLSMKLGRDIKTFFDKMSPSGPTRS